VSDIDTNDPERPGIDRRTIIKRAAATGAVAWTAPVIIGSLASPAGAITCTGPCFRVQFAPDNTGNCNDDSVLVSGTCTATSTLCSNTTNVAAGTSYAAACLTPPGGGGGCSSTAATPTFTLNTTSTTCLGGNCTTPRQILDAKAGNTSTATPCVTGVITGGTSVTFTKPTVGDWTSFQFLIGCGCS
jgi:hypothetical protein